MKTIRISDVTLKQAEGLSFKEKIELSKLLDKLGVSVMELVSIQNAKIDSLLIKSIAAAVHGSVIAVPVQLNRESVDMTWNALKFAKKPRLQVVAPTSSVQMEYFFHKKPEAMLSAIGDTIAACKALCADVEFVADDATRSDAAFLHQALTTAITAGATTVTVCDTAGTMLPLEIAEFVQGLYAAVPELKDVTLGISCANDLSMADSCVIAAIRQGAGEVKAAAYGTGTASLENISRILHARGDHIGAGCCVNTTQLSRTVHQINRMCQPGRNKLATAGSAEEDTGIYLTAHDDLSGVMKAVERLGYDLSEEDGMKVFEAFQSIAAKKEKVTDKELDAIVATSAMQVPATYILDQYVITSGNTISATAHLKITKNGQPKEGISIGDGPIDAAFFAIESITGGHYELDDFQIQAVTEGRGAMGQALVKLRSSGKLYSGMGISTDIVGASIYAYISALNKIAYEEEEA